MNRLLQPRRPVRAPGLHAVGRVPPRGDVRSADPFPEAGDAPFQREVSPFTAVRSCPPRQRVAERRPRVAGAFRPRSHPLFFPRRGATFDLGALGGLGCRRLRTSLRDEDVFGVNRFRGLKPPATFKGSLRDQEAMVGHLVTTSHEPNPVSWSQYVSKLWKTLLPMNRPRPPRRPVRAPGLQAVGRVPHAATCHPRSLAPRGSEIRKSRQP